MKPPLPLEREALASVIQTLAAFGCRPRRRNMRHDPVSDRNGVARRNKKGRLIYARSELAGEPDVTATVPGLGTRLEVEVKRPGKKPTPLQYQRIKEINLLGGIAIWVDGEDIEWLIWALGHFARGAKADLDQTGQSTVFYPTEGDSGRIAKVLTITDQEYETWRLTTR